MTRVADILAAKGDDVLTIASDATVFDAISLMSERGVGSVLVADGDDIRGILTERDYLRKIALQGKSSRKTPVSDIMSTNLVVATPDQEVADAMAVMTEARIRHLPVMDDGRLAGLVSIGDCVKRISKDRKAQVRMLNEYISDRYPG